MSHSWRTRLGTLCWHSFQGAGAASKSPLLRPNKTARRRRWALEHTLAGPAPSMASATIVLVLQGKPVVWSLQEFAYVRQRRRREDLRHSSPRRQSKTRSPWHQCKQNPFSVDGWMRGSQTSSKGRLREAGKSPIQGFSKVALEPLPLPHG